jgi:hypothetical protein
MAKSRVLRELWQFTLDEKKYWLIPVLIMLLLIGAFIFISTSSAVAPFIYTLF